MPSDVAAVSGLWANPRGSVRVHAGPCGAQLCGWVVWASPKAVADATSESGRPLIGTQIFENFRHVEANRWQGTVLVPDIGRRFSGSLTLLGRDALKVKGCVLGGLFCRSQVWQRFEPHGVPLAGASPGSAAPSSAAAAPSPLAGTWVDAAQRTAQLHACGDKVCGTAQGDGGATGPERLEDFGLAGVSKWAGRLYPPGASPVAASLAATDPTHLELKFCRHRLFCVTRWYRRA